MQTSNFPAPGSLAASLKQIFDAVDQRIDQHFASIPLDKMPPCAPGCRTCCDPNVFSWDILELTTCLLTYRTIYPDDYRRLLDTARGASQRALEQLPLLFNGVLEWSPDGQPPKLEQLAPHQEQILAIRDLPCLFLGYDGRCTVYPWRPLICRTYGWAKTYLGTTIGFAVPGCPPFKTAGEGVELLPMPEYLELCQQVMGLAGSISPANHPLLAWFHFEKDLGSNAWLETHGRLVFG